MNDYDSFVKIIELLIIWNKLIITILKGIFEF